MSQAYLALSLVEMGEFDEALALGREAVESAERLETPWLVVQCSLVLGYAAARAGDFDQALVASRRGLEVAKTRDLPLGVALGEPVLGFALAQRGLLVEALARLEPIAAAPALSIFSSFLGEAYLLAGRHDEAAGVAERCRELCVQRKERGYEAWATWLCARIAASREAPDATVADAHYRRALGLAELHGMRPVAAHCQLGMGELHAKLGRHAESRHELAAAVRLYREMGMNHWLARAEAELARIG
jgi:tetratricopeptide (TPR) repeat protein